MKTVVLLAFLGLCRSAYGQSADVPLSLANDRADRISDLRYDVRFTIPRQKTERIRVRETIRFNLKDASKPLQLDFVTDSGEHILVPAQSLKRGENELSYDVVAGDASLNRNTEYLYTLFVPARASIALPVFDQPNLKARWKLTLDIPADWTAVANGAAQTTHTRTIDGDSVKTITFTETKPLPTYLFGFVAGKWKVETGARRVGTRDMTFHFYHRENDSSKVARNRDQVFDLVARSIEQMEAYTGIPYPFDKYDFIAVPAFQFGGMEHSGAVLYQASSLFLDESATQNQKLGRASLIAHETAHMWFGDLVTMSWFNDVWLKEVMANFMAAKIVQPSFPDVNHRLRFILAHYPSAYDVDRTAGTHPIRQQLDNINEAAQLYGAIIYQKAPIVMGMLERMVDAENFRLGMQRYLRENAYGNAVFNDMISALQPYTREDLRAWSRVWVETAGRPPRPRTTSGDVAYGEFELDAQTRDSLLQHLPDVADPIQRIGAWLDMWEALLDHKVDATRMLDLELRALQTEPDEQMTSYILGNLTETYWRYLTEAERNATAGRVEQVLMERMAAATTSSRKAAYFSALRSVALTTPTIERLRRVWARTDTVPGLRLSEDDFVALAASLVIKGAPESLLEEQAARITNADRKARFEFVRPALSHEEAVRDAWFDALRQRENRAHEPWVLEGLAYLNHPLRAQHAVRYLRPALDLLAEVRATGDIFFPKRWMDATLSGHSSKQAAAIVREFLAANPNYPVRLRQIVLQSADPVLRR